MPGQATQAKISLNIRGHKVEVYYNLIYVDGVLRMRVPDEFARWLYSEDPWIRREAWRLLLPHILPPDA